MRAVVLPLLFASTVALAQAPASGPKFEVVSIKPNLGPPTSMRGSNRPDGGFTMVNMPIRFLVLQAYPATDIIGLPSWAENDRYDVGATASLTRPTPDDRRAMMRAMLADRFKLTAHYETREVPAYDLVLARSDGRLGPNMKPADVDCDAQAAAQRAAAEAARPAGAPPAPPLPPPLAALEPTAGKAMPACTFRTGATGLEGDVAMPTLARMIVTSAAGRPVVDKTGLKGSYRVKLDFDRAAGRLDPGAPASDAPSIFTALQEQLGLKLESSRTNVEVLVIDRLERPTEN